MSQCTACLCLSRLSAAALALLIAGCGGGGGGDTPPAPVVTAVTSVSAGVPKYGQKMLVTVTGTALDRGLALSSSACPGMTLSSTAPNVSTATTAYFQCTVSAVGVSRVAVAAAAGGAELGSVSYTVPPPQVTMAVSNGAAVSGNFVITLDPTKAPITVNNFLAYVNAGFYDGRDAPATKTVFHRVIAGFVVQGGGITPFATGVTPVAKAASAPIALEVGVGLSNVQWSVAMARGNTANSATSQFFINLVDNSASNDPSSVSAGYAVFGNVTSGTAIVTSMLAAPCAPVVGLSECAPNPNIVITSATQTQ